MNIQTVKRLKKKFETAVDALLEIRKGEQAELNDKQKLIQADIEELERLKDGERKRVTNKRARKILNSK
ncbi:hypothetical protein FQP88_20205 [Vibrio atlanticus]|nr:hypothetical protein FQP88_20205 [Vibrio atlanticus]